MPCNVVFNVDFNVDLNDDNKVTMLIRLVVIAFKHQSSFNHPRGNFPAMHVLQALAVLLLMMAPPSSSKNPE